MDYSQRVRKTIITGFDRAKEMIGGNHYADYFHSLKNQYPYFCVFGAGSLGSEMIQLLQEMGVTVDYVCDNNFDRAMAQYDLNPTPIRFGDLCAMKENCLVLVSPSNGPIRANEAINYQLKAAGFEHVITNPVWKNMIFLLREITQMDKAVFLSKILEIVSWCEDDRSKALIMDLMDQLFMDYRAIWGVNRIEQYYDPNQYFTDFVRQRSDECFVDGGAFSGDTFESFYRWNLGKYEKYYGFEIDDNNRRVLMEKISRIERDDSKTEIFDCGLFDRNDRLDFFSQRDKSRIYENILNPAGMSRDSVKVRPLDDVLGDQKVTFLKMDIENSEVPALNGAKRIITEQKPLCAISVYHGLKQFVEVPGLLKKLNPNYRIRYRMHSTVGHDIVCYAIDRSENQ